MLRSRTLWWPLACVIVCATLYAAVSAVPVDPVQKEILYRIRSELPALEFVSHYPWTNESIDAICDAYYLYGVTGCNTTGWVSQMAFGLGFQLGEMAPSFADMVELNSFAAYRTFTGPLLPGLGNLTKMTVITLSENTGLVGPIPDEWKNFKELTSFLWYGSNTEASLPDWIGYEWPLLDTFRWGDLSTAQPFPTWLFTVPWLKSINLAGNQFYGEIPDELTNMPRLDVLDLSSNQFNGSFPSNWTVSYRISALYVSDNLLTGDLPAILPEKLSAFFGSGNAFSGSIPDSIFSPRLLEIHLDDNLLSGEIPWDAIANGSGLQFFDVSGNAELGGSLPSSFWGMPKLNTFYFSNTQISGPLPDIITSDCLMQEIRGTNAPVGGPLPSQLSLCSSLYYLYLENAGLSGELPSGLENVTSLRILNLQDNDLEGPLIGDWSKLTSLYEVRLSGNRFSGTVPQSLADLTHVSQLVLYLDNNELDLCGNLLLNEDSIQAAVCNVSAQAFDACGCGDIWAVCLDSDIPSCPVPIEPIEPIVPIDPIVPTSETTPESTTSPDASTPSSPIPAATTPTGTSSASQALSSLLLVSIGYLALISAF